MFAHPDDESLNGPTGKIIKDTKEHNVVLMYVTKGEKADIHPSVQVEDVTRHRQKELEEAVNVLGVEQLIHLGYPDGHLSNELSRTLINDIEKHILVLKPTEIVTYEPRGLTGHIDHIVVTSVVNYLFDKHRSIQTLRYYCMTTKQRECVSDYFVHMPPGYSEEEIDEVIDISDVHHIKMRAISCYLSQLHDIELYKPIQEASQKKEHFIVKHRTL